MKKFVLVGSLVFLMAFGVAIADAAQDNTGCGLGAMLFKGKDDSVLMQVFAVTTNGTSGNQTFGITTGTLECEKPASFVRNERLNEFVAANMDSLAQDIAAGSGESLDTLAELMEVPAAERAHFYATLQTNFSSIFSSPDVQSAQVIDKIAKVTKAS